jgi:Cys-rich protein (TIGR01571 family)
MAYQPPPTGQWSSGLLGCFEDCASCCCACWCPCVVVGRLVEIVDQGITSCLSAGCLFYWLQSCTGCGFLYTCGYRARLRAKYGLGPEPCGDCCTDYWCLPCSLAQQYRELQYRGIRPALGWAENRAVYDQTAPVQQKMSQYQ